ncbi:hypothetical protein GN244_ATG01075 [Phytophthora infestans]|uniref:WRKY transcription factor 19 n=1 Tax=Phytophthora infestans TaxID=4787 RepID=A0A833W8J4_PHYIN|nr:hypothetical protein GN244_ATG01075 [Phytophthora infestans]
MVQRWLVKGSNGEWQLPRQRQPAQPTPLVMHINNGRARDEQVDEVKVHHVHNKFLKDFLARSRTIKTTGTDLSVTQAATGSVDVDERPFVNSKKQYGNEIEEDHDRVEFPSSTHAIIDNKEREQVLVLNGKISPLSTANGKRATPPPTLKPVRKSKKPCSANNLSAQSSPSNGDKSNVKKGLKVDSVSSFDAQATREQDAQATREQDAQATREKDAKDRKMTLNQTIGGISVLCNGQRKCEKERCYMAAYQHDLCLVHGEHFTETGRSSSSSQDFSQGYTRNQDRKLDPSSWPQQFFSQVSDKVARGNKTGNSHQAVGHYNSSAKSRSRSTSPSTSTTKIRPKLQTAEKMSKPTASNAWDLSDLPNLFRRASCKRAVKMKQEKADGTSLAAPDEKISTTKPTRSTGIRGRKPNAPVCKVRRCREKAVGAEGFCPTHDQCKRCVIEGCSNLATNGARGLCRGHGGRVKCTEEGCVKNAHYRGLCNAHGGRKTCRIEGCAKTVNRWGLCSAHGGKRLCHRVGCNKCSQTRGFCASHLREIQDQAGNILPSGVRVHVRFKEDEREDC